MLTRLAAVVLLAAAGLKGCVTYEYEHEIWLRVDGGGTVVVSGRPELWAAFKGVPAVAPEAARALLERSGLTVRRTRVTTRSGVPYVYVSADFDDVNRLAGSPAFPDLRLALTREGNRLRLEGDWRRPDGPRDVSPAVEGNVAVRFHIPSKIYAHDNASEGVERGNILSWRDDVAAGLAGKPIAFGATIDDRSILLSTVFLFGGAIAIAALILVAAVLAVQRRGRRQRAREGEAEKGARV